jgi:Ca-activated chloride channel family protein
MGFLQVVSVSATVAATQEPSKPTFKSGVDLVRISAIVRDRKGNFVPNLSVRDFEVLDGGRPVRIADFQHDRPAVSVALLLDVSGSMEARLDSAREAATFFLDRLDRTQDEAAIFTFDTKLEQVTPFSVGLPALPERLSTIRPFGATSLHDAIAGTARHLTDRGGLRRAVVVFTDGADTWSEMSPAEAAAVASAIDVPVYVVGIVPPIDNPGSDRSAMSTRAFAESNAIAGVAAGTGGRAFHTSSSLDRGVAASQILEELRHQYLIAIESAATPGWHQIVVRTLKKDLVVRARSGYNAGQSRPIS